jgi:hypothetical protein
MPGGIFGNLFGSKAKKKEESQAGEGTSAAGALAVRQPLHMGEHRGRPQPEALPQVPAATADPLPAPPQPQSQPLPQVPSGTAGSLPVPPQPAGPVLGPQLGAGGKVEDKELLTVEKLRERFAFQGQAAQMTEAKELMAMVGKYQQTIRENPVPDGNAPDFITQMGAVNARIMTAHEQLLNTFAEKAQTLRRQAQKVSTRMIMPSEAVGVRLSMMADDCANLALIAQTQKGYLNKLYDDMITAKRANNPWALRRAAGKTYAEILPRLEMYRFESSRAGVEALGSGAINTVYRDTFQGAARVFKRGKAHEWSGGYDSVSRRDISTGVYVMQDRMGYEPEEIRYGDRLAGRAIRDANTAARDVAYSRLNKLFGFDVAVNTQLSQSEEGETSSLMDLAQGDVAANLTYYAGEEWAEIAARYARETHAADLAQIQGEIAQMRQEIDRLEARLMSGEISQAEYESQRAAKQKEIHAKLRLAEKTQRKGPARTVDLTDPRLALQLFQMSVLDLVAGHVDRHEGNYMIDAAAPGGPRVTAIDNDTAFGPETNVEAPTADRADQVRPELSQAFPFVPPEVLTKVMGVTRRNLEEALAGLLTKVQIEAACVRLEKVQAHFQKLAQESHVEEISRENLSGLFGRAKFTGYHAALFAGSVEKRQWFTQKNRKGELQRPIPRPPERR